MKHTRSHAKQYLNEKHEDLLNAARQLFGVANKARKDKVRPDMEQVEKQLINAAILFALAERLRHVAQQ